MPAKPQARRQYDGSRRKVQAETTQREIVRAAHHLFVENGYGTTTIAEVAAAAGVSVPTVYAGFPAKAGLLRRAIETALAGEVRARGGLPADTPLDEARDVIWMCNSPELYTLATKRRWSLNHYVAFVRESLLGLVLRAQPMR
jgi:AcrR family transcriptional regulator